MNTLITCLESPAAERLGWVLVHSLWQLALLAGIYLLVRRLLWRAPPATRYHPALWWISREIRREREHCCDDLAARVCGGRVTYARTLAMLEERRAPLPAAAMAAIGGSLLQRIRRIVGQPAAARTTRGTWLAGTLVVLTVCVILPLSIATAHDVSNLRGAPGEPAFLTRLKKQCDAVYPKYTKRGGVKHLTGLDVWKASEGALATLSDAQGIEELVFVATDLRTPAFDEVAKLTSLKCLRAVNCELLPKQLSAIQNLKKLEDLELQFTVLDLSGEMRAQLLGALTQEESQRRDALKRSGQGDHIIQAVLLTDRAMPHLRNLTGLKTLRLQNTFLSAEGLEQLKPLVDLEVADIGPVGLTGKTTMVLQGLTKLRSLRYFSADDEMVAVLSEISSLEDLDIWSGEVTDIGARHLIKLKKLQRLQIRGNRMTDQGLETLNQLPDLRYLDLTHVQKITADGMDRFRKLRSDVEIRYSQ